MTLTINIFQILRMRVVDKVACSGLVVASILTGIIATKVLNRTFTSSEQTTNNLPILSDFLCGDFYQG